MTFLFQDIPVAHLPPERGRRATCLECELRTPLGAIEDEEPPKRLKNFGIAVGLH